MMNRDNKFDRFGRQGSSASIVRESANGLSYVDYKDVEELRRMMTPNGKIYPRKRLAVNARQQKMIAQAVKRARFMGLLPYTSATV